MSRKLIGALLDSGAHYLAHASAGPSMFGRDLSEQAMADGNTIPAIVTKCIDAVENQGE